MSLSNAKNCNTSGAGRLSGCSLFMQRNDIAMKDVISSIVRKIAALDIFANE